MGNDLNAWAQSTGRWNIGLFIGLIVFFVWLLGFLFAILFLDEETRCALRDHSALKAAFQLGRLDAVVIVLTVTAILVPLGGVFGLIRVEDKALKVARTIAEVEARKEAREVATTVARDMTRYLPRSGDPPTSDRR